MHICRLQQIQRAITDLQNATNNDDATPWLEGLENLLSLLRERCMKANIQLTHTHNNHPVSNIQQQDDYTSWWLFIHLDIVNIHGLLQIEYT